MKIVILGHMGRDEALAERLYGHELHIVGQWQNPGLVEKAEVSGGKFYVINNITNVELVADIVQATKSDMFLTNFDDALAAGVVDSIRQRVSDKRIRNLLIPCPDRAASKVEWDKFYLRELIDEINPSYNPVNFMAKTNDAVTEAISYFETKKINIVIKPRNLTGGKGVKVMGKHFDTFNEAKDYSFQTLLSSTQTGVEIQEKLEGHEFTLQIFTDGNTMIRPPATYDYPYREDGDSGPGTGGMGTFTMSAKQQLPFINEDDYNEAIVLMKKLLEALKQRDQDYKGVLYPTFFKTPKGLKIVEVNARGGDPELINILDLMDDNVDLGEVLKSIALQELREDSVAYKEYASAMVYLVSPEYGYRSGPEYSFTFKPDVVKANECRVRFAAAVRIGKNKYRTVGSSRVVGLSALGATPWEARQKIHSAIYNGFGNHVGNAGNLDYRLDVADEAYIRSLTA